MDVQTPVPFPTTQFPEFYNPETLGGQHEAFTLMEFPFTGVTKRRIAVMDATAVAHYAGVADELVLVEVFPFNEVDPGKALHLIVRAHNAEAAGL